MKLIENITNPNIIPTKNAALYFKTEPFYVDVNQYIHTNNWEIMRSIEILTSKGYAVDLIDRGCHNWAPKKAYDLFLGLGVGNTGKNFVRYAQLSQAPKKVLLAMGPQPDVSNERVLARYKLFHERTGYRAPPMRLVEDVTGDMFIDIAEMADFILCIGEKNTRSYNSFIKYGNILNFYPSTSPAVNFNSDWINTRDLNSFLCFAGNGFICKGVDLVVESFLNNPTKQLHLCGPTSERAFFEYYGNTIKNASNITFHGFIKPGGEVFNELASQCSFIVFCSAAGGCCTSVATALRAGLVPIINSWTSINIDNIGIELSEDGDLIENITAAVNVASIMKKDDYINFVNKSLEKAQIFSQDSFTKSYTEALDIVLKD